MNQNVKKWFRSGFLFLLSLFLMSSVTLTAARAEETEEAETEQPAETQESGETEEPAELSEEAGELPEEMPEELEEMPEAEEELEESLPKANYTIMLYIAGSNLESELANATHNLVQILESKFSDSNIRFLVLTGGSKKWHMPAKYLASANEEFDPAWIGTNTTLWELFSNDYRGKERYRGKMVELSEQTKMVIGEDTVLNTCDPATLKKFINWGVDYAPAEKYGLILWDHGSGPKGGFASDDFEKTFPEGSPEEMLVNLIADALNDNDLYKKGEEGSRKFEFLDFDTCLMGSVETTLAFADYTRAFIASPELEPGTGQDYHWLNDLAANPNMSGYEIGKKVVDLMYKYYMVTEPGNATLTVVDTEKLLNSAFIPTLNKLAAVLKSEANTRQTEANEYLFYDEFASIVPSVKYGGGEYIDLGNLIQKLTVAEKEITLKNVKEEEISDINHYRMEELKPLLEILNNPEIFYHTATDAIVSKESFFRNADASVELQQLRPSGTYLYFPPADRPDGVLSYARVMGETIKGMKNKEAKTFLENYLKTVVDYALIAQFGDKVSMILATTTMKEEELDYDSISDYMEKSGGYWAEDILPVLERRGGETPENIAWLNSIISQQKKETVKDSRITSYETHDLDGQGYQITLDGIRKRAIDGVSVEITAELPAAKNYLAQHKDIADDVSFKEATALSIKTIEGRIDRSFDPGKDIQEYYRNYIKWLNEPNGTWNIEGFTEKLHALQAADQTLRIAPTQYDEDGRLTVTTVRDFGTENAIPVTLIFDSDQKDFNAIYRISVDSGSESQILIKPEDLKEGVTYNLTPVKAVRAPGNKVYYIPVSDKPFVLNSQNAALIGLVNRTAEEIPDIETKEKQKGVTRKAVVTDIYGYSHDITYEVIDHAKGIRYSIKLADAQKVYYSGRVQDPYVVLNDSQLKAGTDFTYITAGGDELKNAGTYEIRLTGKGDYYDTAETEFVILPSDINDTVITGVQDAIYTGKAIEPKPVVMLGEVQMKEGTDYKLSYQNNVKVGEATVTVTGINNLQGSVSISFSILEKLEEIEVYRMYNPNSGEHFYTSSKAEKEALEKAGWKYEGIAFHSLNTSSHPLYRVYNPNSGDHHYTESQEERDYLISAGWKEEGIAFYVTDQESGIPLYRLYNPNAAAGAHHYTASDKERDNLISAGWKDEGIGFYAVK
ncbi:MAG: hypothetical protein IKS32_08460 [Solobacterium sp.]|nr:hypothetical protein [Solobacterium sp.]